MGPGKHAGPERPPSRTHEFGHGGGSYVGGSDGMHETRTERAPPTPPPTHPSTHPPTQTAKHPLTHTHSLTPNTCVRLSLSLSSAQPGCWSSGTCWRWTCRWGSPRGGSIPWWPCDRRPLCVADVATPTLYHVRAAARVGGWSWHLAGASGVVWAVAVVLCGQEASGGSIVGHAAWASLLVPHWTGVGGWVGGSSAPSTHKKVMLMVFRVGR